jgi:hypothetical protein
MAQKDAIPYSLGAQHACGSGWSWLFGGSGVRIPRLQKHVVY